MVLSTGALPLVRIRTFLIFEYVQFWGVGLGPTLTVCLTKKILLYTSDPDQSSWSLALLTWRKDTAFKTE